MKNGPRLLASHDQILSDNKTLTLTFKDKQEFSDAQGLMKTYIETHIENELKIHVDTSFLENSIKIQCKNKDQASILKDHLEFLKKDNQVTSTPFNFFQNNQRAIVGTTAAAALAAATAAVAFKFKNR